MSDLTLQWYTRARRLPRLIGKVPGGHDIPGGPYTITQAVGTAVVVVVGYATTGIWGTDNGLTNYGILFVVALVTLIGLRFVKNTGRNPIAAGVSLVGAFTSPVQGTYRGRAIRTPRPHGVQHRILACVPPPAAEVGSADLGAQVEPERLEQEVTSSAPTHAEPAQVGEQVHEEPLLEAAAAASAESAFADGNDIQQIPSSIHRTPDEESVDEVDDVVFTRPVEQMKPMSNVQRLLADFDVKGRAS